MCEEERLDPEAVAPEEEDVTVDVDDREREHAAEPAEHVAAVLLVEVGKDLGVAAAAEAMAPALEVASQLVMVVELAVEDDDDRSVLVRHRLVAQRRQVDDPEPRVDEARSSDALMRRSVRAAMRQEAEDRAAASPSDGAGSPSQPASPHISTVPQTAARPRGTRTRNADFRTIATSHASGLRDARAHARACESSAGRGASMSRASMSATCRRW